jgi:DNA-binding CsgD family transcriptional regulator
VSEGIDPEPLPECELPRSLIAPAETAIEAISELALMATEPVELDALARRATEVARDLLRADGGSLFLWHEARARLAPVTANDPGWDVRAIRSFLPGEGVTGATYQAGRPLIVRDYPASPHAVATAVRQGVRSGVSVPIMVGPRRVGVLSARSFHHLPWTPRHARLLSLVASVIGPGLEAARSQARASGLRLTAREAQVLADLTAGKSARSIARQCRLSEATVRTHIRSVLGKLGVNSQLAAVALARDLGFAGPLVDADATRSPHQI